jgi:hypothetical protein
MLRVTVEIVPFGVEDKARTIGTIEIARTTLRADPETYNCRRYADTGELLESWLVKDHYYRDGAWELVRRAIECSVMKKTR